MPRFRIAILVGLLLAGSSRAQPPGEAFELPKPNQVVPGQAEPMAPTPTPITVETAAPATANAETTGPMIMEETSPNNSWRFWAQADYAMAWLKGKSLPPLATTSPVPTPQGIAGVEGSPNTRPLIGETPITLEGRPQGRLDFGMWFNPERTFGVASGFFVTESKGQSFVATSNGSTIIARPFTDDATAKPSSVLVAFPGVSSGSVNVYASSQTFWGAYLDMKEAIASESWWRIESLLGYRYLHYDEGLNMQQNLLATGGAFIPGTKIVATDSFQTKNDFNGVEFGFNTEVFRDRWSLDILTKLGVGDIRREVSISGSTQTSVPGSTTTTGVGGVYALSSNIGNHYDSSWVVVPELGLNLGYQLSTNVRLHLGYSILYLQGIARAGDQIDFTLNQALFPPAITTGAVRPAANTVQTDIWIQSINFGVEIRF